MGKSKKKNQRKYSTKPAGNRNETTASTSTDDIQVTGNSAHNMTEAAAEQSSLTPGSISDEEAIKGLVDAIIECMKVEWDIRQMSDSQREELNEIAVQNIFTMNALNRDLNRLLSEKDPRFVKVVEKYITFQAELRYLKDNVPTQQEIETVVKAEGSNKIWESIEQEDSNEHRKMENSDQQYEPDEMKLDLKPGEKNRGDCEKRDRLLNIEETAEYIPSFQHLNERGKICSAQNKYGTFNSSQSDTEGVFKTLDSKLENYEKKRRSVELAVKIWKEKQDSTSPKQEMPAGIPKHKLDDGSKEAAGKVNHLIQEMKRVAIQKKDVKSIDETQTAKHLANIAKKGKTDKKDGTGDFLSAGHSPKNVTEGKKGTDLKISKQKIDTLSSEMDEWALRIVSKESADQVSDLIKVLEAEIEKEVKKSEETSVDEIQISECFPGNLTEAKADTKDSNESTGDLQVEEDSLIDTMLSIVTDKMTCEHMRGKRSPGKGQPKKRKTDEKFQSDLKKFLMLQNSKLDQQMKASGFRDVQSKLLKETPGLSLDKDSATSEAEKQIETGTKRKSKVVTTDSKQDLTVQFDNIVHISFDFQTDGDKYIQVGNREFIYSLEDKLEYEFEFSDEKAKVYFSGDHIYISTENSEYDIFVQKLQTADLKDGATQTDAKP